MFAPSQPKAQNDGSDGPGNTNVNGCPPPFPRQPCHRKTGDHRGLKPRQHASSPPPPLSFRLSFPLSLFSCVCLSLAPDRTRVQMDPGLHTRLARPPHPPYHRKRGDLRGLKARQHAVSVSFVPYPHFARAPLSLFSCVSLSRPRAQNKGSDGPRNPHATGKNPSFTLSLQERGSWRPATPIII
jgi:hypothetical protein